ncbi:MAG: hypothetical protein NXI32_25475 [bacterium]|nr:hypothetical protein [bacterium]
MYRIGLFILLATQAQLGFSQSQADSTRDFGWMIDKEDQALVYIVQVAPGQATQMQLNRLENLSDIPPALVGRATRISVRIGTDPLPRIPSLEEIQKMPRYGTASDVTAALGPGRISDLEPGSVVNVQGPTLPSSTFPDSNFAANPTLPAPATLPNVGSQTRNDSNSVTPPSAFGASGQSSRSGTSGSLSDLLIKPPASPGNQIPTPTLPANLNGQSVPPNYSAPAGEYANRSQPANGFGAVNPADSTSRGTSGLPTNPGMGTFPSRTPASLTADGSYAGLPPAVGNDARSPVPNYGSAPGANAPPVFDRNSPNTPGNFPNPGYANENSNPANYGRNAPTNADYANRGGAPNVYGPPAYGSNDYGRDPNGFGNRTPPAFNTQTPAGPPAYQTGAGSPDPNASYADSRSASDRGLAADATSNIRGGSATDPKAGSYDPSQSSAANSPAAANMNAGNVLVQMFFLVSLVANVYLVFLIRKLLSRYRSLLATVRSHAA